MSSVNMLGITPRPDADLKNNFSTTQSIPLAEEKLSRIHADEAQPVQLSKEAIEKNQKEILQVRNRDLKSNLSQQNLIVNDIDKYFSKLQLHSSMSDLDMGGLISEALQVPGGSGNSTTLSMDLTATKAKLDYLVNKFVPSEHHSESFLEVDAYISKKASDNDNVIEKLTSASLEIAIQYNRGSDAIYYKQQVDLLDIGQQNSQIERNKMLSLPNSTSDSSSWLSGLHRIIDSNADDAFSKNIERAHITKLTQQWTKFTELVGKLSS